MPGMTCESSKCQKRHYSSRLCPLWRFLRKIGCPVFGSWAGAALHKNCCLCLVRCWRWSWPAVDEHRSRGIGELARGVAGWWLSVVPLRGSTARAACSSVNGGGKVNHMGGSIVGLRLSTFRGNVRLIVQQKCHLSNPGSYQMSIAPVVRFAAAVYSDPENGPESAPLCPLWPICVSPWTVCLSLFGRRR